MNKTCLATIALATCIGIARADDAATIDPLDQYNVTWTTPSPDCSGSMPIGNGDVGLNVWVEPTGDLLFYISKTDAWSENCRLLKLGRVRVTVARTTPAATAENAPFRQTLRLRQGEIEIVAGQDDKAVKLRVWVDANRPVVHVDAAAPREFDVRVALETWRTERRELTGKEIHSAYGLHGGPDRVFVEPDTIVPEQANRVLWYHRNERSIWPANLKHQGMETFIAKSTDPLLGRTFGGCLQGAGLVTENATTLRSQSPRKHFTIAIHPLTAQTETAGKWIELLDRQIAAADAVPPRESLAAHRRWWDEFWNRSWIRLGGSSNEAVSRGYTLQRWINACAGRGHSPIKFNGTIFNVDGAGYDADYRAWGGPYWWQNTRLPYWPMLAAGDFDMMGPMFRMYQETLPLAVERTRVWFDHGGAFLPETMYFWGMFTNGNYGWQRNGLHVSELTNRYIRREYTSSPELLAMMLDYHAYTADEKFLQENLLPMADALLQFWDEHYQRDDNGKLHLEPAQALETLQNCVNPATDVAGLHWVLGKLLQLPADRLDAERRKRWTRLAGEIPPLALGDRQGKKYVLGAGKIIGGRGNSENPAMYTVFPFRIYGVGKPDLDVGRLTYALRHVKGNNGWRQDDTQAAFLGLADEAARYVIGRAATKHGGSRFPAFWGPNMDWIPDQDHGGNLMMALQTMLLQTEDDTIRLFPAWPKDWDVEFKLHAPRRTTVEGVYRDGKLQRLVVEPPSRAADVVVLDPQ